MIIYIKQSNGHSLYIPIPLSVAGFCCRFAGFIIMKSKKYIPQNQMEYMDCIDFKALSMSFHQLKGYKGLRLVDIKTISGDEIKIVL